MEKTLTLQEIKETELEILKFVANICDKNHIKYSLIYGTLLGAIRHKGFIPWDDDIDLCLLRKDYEKLLEVLSINNDKRFHLLKPGDTGYALPFAKVVDSHTQILREGNMKMTDGRGLYIDLFPIDHFTSSKSLKWLILHFLFYMNYLATPAEGPIKSNLPPIFTTFAKKCGVEYWAKKVSDFSAKYFSKGKYLVMFPVIEQCFPLSMFDDMTTCTFEGCEFSTIKDFDTFLKIAYGDYMKLPPINERMTHNLEVIRILPKQ